MSLTIVQRFYELSKQEAEAPALGWKDDETYHELPWWFVKSKAKHLALGLLEEGAQPGQYFYLYPSSQPQWVYAELAALTLGLHTVPLPGNLPTLRLGEIGKRYPPSFIFLGKASLTSLPPELAKEKSLKRIILENERPVSSHDLSSLSFRQVFNSGIRNESKHHALYRKLRESFSDTHVMSPVQVDENGNLWEREFTFGEVNAALAKLSHLCPLRKAKKILSPSSFTPTMTRLVCLYWPIFLGIQSFLRNEEDDFPLLLKKARPNLAYLQGADLKDFESWVENESETGGGSFWKNFFRRLRYVLSIEDPSPRLQKQLDLLKVKWIPLHSSNLQNFLL